MKKYLFLTLFIASLFNSLFSQNDKTVQGINYQAIARDPSGKEMINKEITVVFSIYEGLTVTPGFKETQKTVTNEFGLFNLIIGATNPNQLINGLNWDTITPHYLEVSVDGFTVGGKMQFQAVPYAFAASRAIRAKASGKADIADTATVAKSVAFRVDTVSNGNSYPLDINTSVLIVKGLATASTYINLPSALEAKGRLYYIKNVSKGTVTIKPSASNSMIDNQNSFSFFPPETIIISTYTFNTTGCVTITSDGKDWWILSRN